MKLRLKHLEIGDYRQTWAAMREFTESRTDSTEDEIWLVEHPPVYTLGRNGDPAHILTHHPSARDLPVDIDDIPIVKTDRGGQVTYHGPGQLIVYTLFDINRLGIGVRSLVSGLENAVIATLSQYGLRGEARRDAPGVYIDGKKIASLGLRIHKGRSYHGLSLNVDMDCRPFTAINPCGYAGLEVTQLRDLGVRVKPMEAAIPLIRAMADEFGYQCF
ncbi:MAG: lipoyl(octanoyl) transferase LipB [Methylococcaceae bacterium]|nr:lipoyl(octanoyl) transferase LipB [Methylococcaceae bacterium]